LLPAVAAVSIQAWKGTYESNLPALLVLAISGCFLCARWRSEDYKGKPFQDSTYSAGPQSIPGRLQATRYDLGGEGLPITTRTRSNHGSGELNYKPEQCEAGVPAYVCHFRENEGVDISYVKKKPRPESCNGSRRKWQQLYIGWTEDGEWTNYTVEVKKAGTYRIVACIPISGRPSSFH